MTSTEAAGPHLPVPRHAAAAPLRCRWRRHAVSAAAPGNFRDGNIHEKIHEKIPELNGGVVFFWEKYPRPIAGWCSMKLITRVSWKHMSAAWWSVHALFRCGTFWVGLKWGGSILAWGYPQGPIQSSWMTTTRIETYGDHWGSHGRS